jgi:hypothetical protein
MQSHHKDNADLVGYMFNRAENTKQDLLLPKKVFQIVF